MFAELVTDGMTAVLMLIIVGLGVWWCGRRPSGVPPGPWFTLPIFGNLFQIGSNPVMSIRKLSKTYGDVFSVYFGSRLVIMINGFENIKETLVKNAEVFVDRPRLFTLDILTKNKGILGCNGEAWREQRKLAIMTLKNLGMGKNILEDKIQEETTALHRELTKTKGEAFDIQHIVSTSVCNVISSMVFGKRFEFDDPQFVHFLKVTEDSISMPIMLSFFSFLRYIPGDPFRFRQIANQIQTILIDLVDTSLEEHLAHYDDNNINDFISTYIKEMKSLEALGKNSSINKENLRMTIWSLFIAGTETSATTIRWLVLYFLHFPEIQDRCFAEIKQKIGCKKRISLQDKTDLPYIEATIMETLRYAVVVPFTMRSISKDITWKGFKIPKDTIMMPVTASAMSDPEIWGDPDNFRPDRFLDENGRVSKPEEHIPFLIGPRNCLGESLARMELFLFVSTMIQKFEFVKEDGCPLPTFDPIMGVTQAPKPYTVRAVARDTP